MKHGSMGVVSALVNDILSEVVGQTNLEEEGIEAVEDDGLSPYEKIRNQNIAEIRRKFRSLFEEEIQESERKKKRGKTRRKSTPSTAGRRRSGRNAEEGCAPELGSYGTEELEEMGFEEVVSIPQEKEDGGNPIGADAAEHQPDMELDSQASGDMVQVSDAKFGCIPCGMKFRDMTNMRRHVKLIHEPKLTPVSCPRTWCKSTFSTMADMFRHRKTCLLACPDCGKTFQKVAKFDAHQRAHKTMARRMADW